MVSRPRPAGIARLDRSRLLGSCSSPVGEAEEVDLVVAGDAAAVRRRRRGSALRTRSGARGRRAARIPRDHRIRRASPPPRRGTPGSGPRRRARGPGACRVPRAPSGRTTRAGPRAAHPVPPPRRRAAPACVQIGRDRRLGHHLHCGDLERSAHRTTLALAALGSSPLGRPGGLTGSPLAAARRLPARRQVHSDRGSALRASACGPPSGSPSCR